MVTLSRRLGRAPPQAIRRSFPVPPALAGIRMVKKIALLGDVSVGKTSLIRRFVLDEFEDRYIETIGTKVSRREVSLTAPSGDPVEVNLIVWDIIGHKDPRRVPASYYKGVAGVIVVCDSTKFVTFTELDFWVGRMRSLAGATTPMVFLANKADLPNREVTEENLHGLAKTFSMPHLYTSARTGENVAEAFKVIAQLVAAPELRGAPASPPP